MFGFVACWSSSAFACWFVTMKSRSRRCEDVVKVSTLGKVRRSRDLPVAAARKNNYIKVKSRSEAEEGEGEEEEST